GRRFRGRRRRRRRRRRGGRGRGGGRRSVVHPETWRSITHGTLERRWLAVPAAVVPLPGGYHLDSDGLLLQLPSDPVLRYGGGAGPHGDAGHGPCQSRPLVVPVGRDAHVHHRLAVPPPPDGPARRAA